MTMMMGDDDKSFPDWPPPLPQLAAAENAPPQLFVLVGIW